MNKIEHRLFAHTSITWRGRPLVNHKVVVEVSGATIIPTGFQVQIEGQTVASRVKTKVSDEALAAVRLTPHTLVEEWNYTMPPF